MANNHTYDAAVIGGGLAGLALAIQLADRGHAVALFEKEHYPFHRVCGEYISMESWDFLCRLGVPLPEMQLPSISTLQLTAPNGRMLETKLPLGGFGVSRFTLDAVLADIARKKGVALFEGSRVEALVQQPHSTQLDVRTPAGNLTFSAKLVAGAWGKRSNIDVKWKRDFVQDQGTRISNWVGIKYHVQTNWPENRIALHNFRDGYCGISRIEDGKSCLCYLTRASNLKAYGSIAAMEAAVLWRNPVLRGILAGITVEPGFPLSISQVSFQPKAQVEQGVLLLGDAAGMIAPLCGNGMSMALQGSRVAAVVGDAFLTGTATRKGMEAQYTTQWRTLFGRRLLAGRLLQRCFGSEWRSNMLIGSMRHFPAATSALIRQTHGKPF